MISFFRRSGSAINLEKRLGASPRTSEVSASHDFRLLPVALVLWIGGLGGLLCGWYWTLIFGIATVLISVVLFFRFRRFHPRWCVAAVALLLSGIVLCLPTCLTILNSQQNSLRDQAARGAQISFQATLSERPRPIQSAGYASQAAGARFVTMKAEITKAAIAGSPVDSTGEVLVVADFSSWSTLLPGQEVTAIGKLAPVRDSDLTVAVVYVRGPPAASGPAPWWQRWTEHPREQLRQSSAVLSEDAAGLLPGLIVGDTSTLSPRLETDFKDAGLAHLLAVSGSNLTIVCGAVLLLLRLCRIGPRVSASVATLTLLGFVILVGPEPSVLRAGVMAAIGLLALALGRKGSALSTLCAAVAFLLAVDPALAVSWGFALSVFATAALVLLVPRWSKAAVHRGWRPGFAQVVFVPIAAFAATAPIVAGMVGQISLVTVLANILAAPVVTPITVLGMIATLLGTVWTSAAAVLVHLAGPEVNWLIFIAQQLSSVPGAVVPWPDGWVGALLVLAALGTLALLLRHRSVRIGLTLVVVGILLIVVPIRVFAPGWPPERWAVVACDVGQGDAVVLATAEAGRAVVVDTGPELGPVADCLDRLNVDRVPLVVLSHLHADHIGGLASVFEGRSVGAIAVGLGRAPDWAWRQISQIANRFHVPVVELRNGQHLSWPGLALDVLGPQYVSAQQVDTQDGTEINNASVVLKASTPAGRVVLSGDVELAAQDDLLANGVDLQAEILKVPHHGSRYSLPHFMSAVRPRLALVSVGAGNSYGHPNKTTLDTLLGLGTLIARTDLDGDLAVLADTQGPVLVRRGHQRAPP